MRVFLLLPLIVLTACSGRELLKCEHLETGASFTYSHSATVENDVDQTIVFKDFKVPRWRVTGIISRSDFHMWQCGLPVEGE